MSWLQRQQLCTDLSLNSHNCVRSTSSRKLLTCYHSDFASLTELKLITIVRQTFLPRNRWISISIYFLFLKISPNNFDSHFSYEWCRTSLKSWKFSHTVVSDSAIPWTVACQAPLFLEFSRQESWSGFPFPPPGRTSLHLSKCLLRASPGGSTVKNCTTMQETVGWIPGSGISPGEGNGNPLQYSCLGNPTDRGACGLQSMGSQQSQTQLSN